MTLAAPSDAETTRAPRRALKVPPAAVLFGIVWHALIVLCALFADALGLTTSPA